MSYQSAIDQLSAMVPELYTQPGHVRRKFSLDEIGILLGALGSPHRSFPSVLIAAAEVRIAVLEVGMGGRLDATNIVDPLLSIVTDISLDHTEWLGSTIAEIAREKAGILRRGGTLITLPQHPEANRVLGETAVSLDVLGISAVPYMPPINASADAPYTVEALGTSVEVASPLRGAHQHRNIALAITASVELAISHGLPVTAASIADGIRRTSWPARFERITSGGSDWILDDGGCCNGQAVADG